MSSGQIMSGGSEYSNPLIEAEPAHEPNCHLRDHATSVQIDKAFIDGLQSSILRGH